MPKQRTKYWIGVASRDHVMKGVAGGFAQLSHGKAEPLTRMAIGDWIIYYSGRERFGEHTPAQSFTAIGRITGPDVYRVAMVNGFRPFRRRVSFRKRITEVGVRPLISKLTFITNETHWGLAFRRGFFEISRKDFGTISRPMLRSK